MNSRSRLLAWTFAGLAGLALQAPTGAATVTPNLDGTYTINLTPPTIADPTAGTYSYDTGVGSGYSADSNAILSNTYFYVDGFSPNEYLVETGGPGAGGTLTYQFSEQGFSSLSISQAAQDYYGYADDGGYITGSYDVAGGASGQFLDTATPGTSVYSTESIPLPTDNLLHDVTVTYAITLGSRGQLYTPLLRGGQGEFTVTGVAAPEPSSLVLAAMAGLFLTTRPRRRA